MNRNTGASVVSRREALNRIAAAAGLGLVAVASRPIEVLAWQARGAASRPVRQDPLPI